MHPDFSHCYKRYLLNIVMYCLCLHDLEGKSWYRISIETGIFPRTLLHWHDGFFQNEHIKKICFFPMSHSPPEEIICLRLLELFDSDDTAITAFQGMVQLFHGYDCPLY
jgi:hypothetical protein